MSARLPRRKPNSRLFITVALSPPPPSAAVNPPEGSLYTAFIMADDIVIDKQLFHERLSSLVTKWKADKRSGDAIFQGASGIAAMVGKPSDPGTYLKPAAFQVSSER
jgi:hypothetical protein